jgi:hypothetical protein
MKPRTFFLIFIFLKCKNCDMWHGVIGYLVNKELHIVIISCKKNVKIYGWS